MGWRSDAPPLRYAFSTAEEGLRGWDASESTLAPLTQGHVEAVVVDALGSEVVLPLAEVTPRAASVALPEDLGLLLTQCRKLPQPLPS